MFMFVTVFGFAIGQAGGGGGMTAFVGFGATPLRTEREFLCPGQSLLVPLCIAPRSCATAPSSEMFGRPGDVGPKGCPLFVDRFFRAFMQPETGPVLRPSRHPSQHTMSESGRAPGPAAGSFSSHRITVFPSFGTPKEFLIRGRWV